MLESIYINNFKLFKDFSIDRLGAINLIVGQNNTGKSCLLEAIRVYGAQAAPEVLFDLITDRGQDWEFKVPPRSPHQTIPEMENPLRYLFHGYRFPDIGTEPISIGPTASHRDCLKMHLQCYRRQEGFQMSLFSQPSDDDRQPDPDLDDTEMIIKISKGDRIKSVRLNRPPESHRRRRRYATSPNGNGDVPVQLVSTQPIDDETISILWDNINIHPHLRREVFRALQLIDEKIEEIVLVGRKQYITPILIYADSDERIPLKSMGDGTIRLFQMILAMVNARGGTVLIDEFENGLHYLLQPRIWDLIFRLAKQLSVQVFATTHSWDCVHGFQTVMSQHNEEGRLIHLGYGAKRGDREQIVATGYVKDELQLAEQADLEVR